MFSASKSSGPIGYYINNSLRLRASATASLSKTNFSSTTYTYTLSMWVKRGKLGVEQILTCARATGAGNTSYLEFNSSDNLNLYLNAGATSLTTTAVFRDPSSWYHIVLSVAQSGNSVIYVNGVQVGSVSTGSSPFLFNSGGTYTNALGIYGQTTSNPFDGFFAEINYIDGQALTPTSFGAYSTTTGVWQPIKYTGTYGTNGFYLKFNNTTSTTTLGYDSSGNSNNWTCNNISLTAGATYDSMTDVPTLTSATAANFAVLSPLLPSSSSIGTIADGGLTTTISTSGYNAVSEFGMSSGKFYWEYTWTYNAHGLNVGIDSNTNFSGTQAAGVLSTGYGYYNATGNKYNNNTGTSYGTAWYTSGNTYVIGVAFDATNGTLTFYLNGVSQGTAFTGIPAGTYFPTTSFKSGTGSSTVYFNFGQQPFSYTPPSGFSALNTYNLPTPAIIYAAPYMNAITYKGGPLQPTNLGIPTKRNASSYNVAKSLRFRSSASAYLNRTFTTPTNGIKWTWSGWIKRGTLGVEQSFFAAAGTNQRSYLEFTSGDSIQFQIGNGSTSPVLVTNQLFRDPSSWYHLVFVLDTANATSTNRMLMYVNGVQVTSFSTSSYPTQNFQPYFNTAITHYIGDFQSSLAFFDGYLAEVNFIDGQALTPSSFGTTNSDGIWVPQSYGGSYGTNGFYLPFSNTTSTTTLGYDSSGNGNNWTTNNISLTTGTTYDSMIDTPTDYSSTEANYAVMNYLTSSYATILDGNLRISGGTGYASSTIAMQSGKWYFEMTVIAVGAESSVGLTTNPTGNSGGYVGSDANSWGYYSNGNKETNGSASSYGASYTNGDVVGIAFDAGAGTLTFYKNGVSQGTAFTGLTSGPYYFAVEGRTSGGTNNVGINFGQQPFSYSLPSGFSALNTYNFAQPTSQIFTPSNTQTPSQLYYWWAKGSYPDLVWLKSRSTTGDHTLVDTVRGPTLSLESDLTNAEAGLATTMSVNKYGLTLGNNSDANISGTTYVGWGWSAGSNTTSQNTNGSITSTVSVNQTAGFSIVTYTGTGSNATVGHGLGVAPSMVIVKVRNTSSGTYSWPVYHSSLGGPQYALQLNSTSAVVNDTSIWNTAPTSTVFGVGSTLGSNGGSSYNYVAYCFAAIAGYSAFGSYTGNGSTDGPFVYCGFRPRFILIKCTTQTTNWHIADTSRDSYNVSQNALWTNLNSAESNGSNQYIDILSNGFKIRNATGEMNNSSSDTYIYAAFAENPFKYALAR
jgi:SPRY domain/Concanavalin A-like lectin/glucanases superfamily